MVDPRRTANERDSSLLQTNAETHAESRLEGRHYGTGIRKRRMKVLRLVVGLGIYSSYT
jgi:hypothetical protein